MSWNTALPTLSDQSKATSTEVIKANTPNGWLYPLETFSVLTISGPDRFSFLQGQATCDAQRLENGEPLLGAHLNLQGRIEASFIAIPSENSLQLILPPLQAEYLKSLLQKYTLFSEVTIEESSESLPYFYWSDSTPAESIYRNPQSDQLCFGITNKELLAPMIENVELGNDHDANAILLRNGFCLVDSDQQGLYLPQELNYDSLDGISFNKGCYKGQEVVARIHFRGQVKQRVHPFFSSGTTPTTGKVISTSGAKCGDIISSISSSNAPTSTFGCILLKTAETESKTVHLEQNDAAELQLLDRPYAIT